MCYFAHLIWNVSVSEIKGFLLGIIFLELSGRSLPCCCGCQQGSYISVASDLTVFQPQQDLCCAAQLEEQNFKIIFNLHNSNIICTIRRNPLENQIPVQEECQAFQPQQGFLSVRSIVPKTLPLWMVKPRKTDRPCEVCPKKQLQYPQRWELGHALKTRLDVFLTQACISNAAKWQTTASKKLVQKSSFIQLERVFKTDN